jgi:phosphoglucosamine mutase
MSLEKMLIAVDVANGAGYKSTPCILRELGADICVEHNEPNGTNINEKCGSTYPSEIQRMVKESGAQVGITNDGDADRVLLCDENGEIVDGDEILAIASIELQLTGCAKTRRRHGDEQFWFGRSAERGGRQSFEPGR